MHLPIIIIVPVALGVFAAGALAAVLVTARRCEDEAARRFIAGLEEGRRQATTFTGEGLMSRDEIERGAAAALAHILEEQERDVTPDLFTETAVGSVRPPSRLRRRLTRSWTRDQERRARVAGMVGRGVGM